VVFLHTLARWGGGKPAAWPAAAPAAAAPFPAIEGLDVVAGLRRVNGKVELYRQILSQFAMNHAATRERLQAAFAAADHEKLAIELHTIKGVAGNIGAASIGERAAGLESTARHGSVEPSVFAAFLDALEALALAIPRAISDTVVAAPQAAMADPTGVAPLVRQLAAYLADHDSEAIDYLITHAAALRTVLPEAGYAALERAVYNFEYGLALNILSTLGKGYGNDD
jgi:HPt (histidine-containing phosphotransfer) domain-containing protein